MTDYEEIVKTRMAEIGANNGKPGSTAACLQVESEMIWLAPFIDKLKPKVILEIGIYKAGWPYVLAPFFAEGAHIIGIDAMLRHSWGGDDGRKDLDARLGTLREQGFMVDVIEGRSDQAEVAGAVSRHLRRCVGDAMLSDSSLPIAERMATALIEPMDLLHIDGAHDYESAWNDWMHYNLLVRSGGLIVLHDIGTQTSQMNVKKLWEDVKGWGFTTHEFYEKNGIGVVEM